MSTLWSPAFRGSRPRAPKLHWRDLGRDRQLKVLEAVAEARPSVTLVVGSPMNPRKQERARRKCLEALVAALSDSGVDELVLEARGGKPDLRDVLLIDSMRSKGLGADFRLTHSRGAEDPRLWVPDQVLGAFGDRLCGAAHEVPSDAAWRTLEADMRVEKVQL